MSPFKAGHSGLIFLWRFQKKKKDQGHFIYIGKLISLYFWSTKEAISICEMETQPNTQNKMSFLIFFFSKLRSWISCQDGMLALGSVLPVHRSHS